jgi:phage baseplate assembly protein W
MLMPGISPKLPLALDTIDLAYKSNKTLKESIQQNLKSLILTNPGEKIMDSRFGVGLKQFLFQNFSPTVAENISNTINVQVKRYMPFININQIKVNDSQDENKLFVTIIYNVPNLSIQNILSLDIPRQ